MRTDLEISGSEPTNPDLFPRRSLRPGVTRMVRSTAIPLLILAGIALCTPEATADLYSMVDYNNPDLQNGYTVGGTITATVAGGITAWDITISQGTDILITFNKANSEFAKYQNDAQPVITPTTIYALTNQITALISTLPNASAELYWYPGDIYEGYTDHLLWQTNIQASDFTIATVEAVSVPEPSTCLLAVCGVMSGIAYAEVRKRRAKRRRDGGGQS